MYIYIYDGEITQQSDVWMHMKMRGYLQMAIKTWANYDKPIKHGVSIFRQTHLDKLIYPTMLAYKSKGYLHLSIDLHLTSVPNPLSFLSFILVGSM